MKEIGFIDETIRGAQQSLWGFLMSPDMITPIAPVMDRVGYRSIGVIGGRGGVVALRKLKQSVFDVFRLANKLMPNTPLRSSFTAWSTFGFGVEPLAIIELWIKRAVANGIRSFWVPDYQNMMDRLSYLAKVAKDEGAEVVVTLAYTYSPVHTTELFARKTKMLVEMGNVDVIQLGGGGGTLTPEVTRALLPIIKEESKGISIEIREHCNIGLAPLSYVEAIKSGVQRVTTAVSPLANGDSLPSTENILRNIRRMGYSSNIDEEALKEESDHFRRIAEERGMKMGELQEYDVFQYEHQVPGAMMGTLRNQLTELGIGQRLDEVLEEVARVRKDFGYPYMTTPYSQIVVGQSVYNVTSGERYKVVPKEVAQYASGFFGEPDGPMNPNVKDKILNSPWGKKTQNQKVPDVTVEDVRNLEPGISDDDLLIKIADPEGEFKDKLEVLIGSK